MVAIGLLTLVGFTGFALDLGRLYLLKSQLQSAVDAAGLSAMARDGSPAAVEADVRRFIAANLEGSGASAARLSSVSVRPLDGGETLEVTARLEADSGFMGLFGVPTLPAAASTRIARRQEGSMEVALVLDVTLSMGPADMRALKAGALKLVASLYGDRRDGGDNLRMAVVPFNTGVNVGPNYRNWLKSPFSQFVGCFKARPGDMDLGIVAPRELAFGWDRDRYNFESSEALASTCPDPKVLPLTSDRRQVESAISGLGNAGKGLTHVNWGAVWGWRVLAAEWQSLWLPGRSRSVSAGRSTPQKTMVLMTDGDNFGVDASSSAYYKVARYKDDDLNRRLSRVCENAKKDGMVIYTIAYGSEVAIGSSGRAIREVLQGCATKADYFFVAPNPEQLEDAFAQVATTTSSLRIMR